MTTTTKGGGNPCLKASGAHALIVTDCSVTTQFLYFGPQTRSLFFQSLCCIDNLSLGW